MWTVPITPVLINKVEGLIKDGAKDFLIDLSDVPFMSSAGLVALHSMAITLRGEKPVDPQAGWAAIKSMGQVRELGMQTAYQAAESATVRGRYV